MLGLSGTVGLSGNVLLPRVTQQYPAVTGSPSVTVVLAAHVSVANARDLTLIFRVHNGTTFATGGAISSVSLFPEAPTADDPGSDFVSTAFLTQITSITATAPTLYQSGISNTSGFGSFVRLVMSIIPPTSGTMILNISADLVQKS
jgi:hypothetical protein